MGARRTIWTPSPRRLENASPSAVWRPRAEDEPRPLSFRPQALSCSYCLVMYEPSVAAFATAEPVLTDDGVNAGIRVDRTDRQDRVEPFQIVGTAAVGANSGPGDEIEGAVPLRRALSGACRCGQNDVTLDASGGRVRKDRRHAYVRNRGPLQKRKVGRRDPA